MQPIASLGELVAQNLNLEAKTADIVKGLWERVPEKEALATISHSFTTMRNGFEVRTVQKITAKITAVEKINEHEFKIRFEPLE